jgi:tape measure domain-containing protein
MAKDLEELVLSISADNRQMLRILKKLEGDTSATTRKVEKQFDEMAKKINGSLDGIGKNSFRGLIGGVAAALGAGELIRLTDTWTDLNSRVNLAAGSMEKGEEVMGRLGEMARRTYSSLEQTAESYIGNAAALKELGYATNDQLDYTEALNNALVISAAKGQRAEAVQNALAKAMAGGRLQGENLNTVIQQGGRVAEALAAGLGVGVNQLRALGAEGKITSRDVFKALTSQMGALRKEAESMPATISDGVQLLRNALLEYVGNADKATGVSRNISDALVIMADNFDKTADVALQLAGVVAGALVGRSLAVMIAKLGLGTQALLGFIRALMAARAAGGLAAAFGGLSAAAGPAGLVIGGAVVGALTLFSSSSGEAGKAADRFAERLRKMDEAADKSAGVVEETGRRYSEAMKNALAGEATAAANELDAAHGAAVKLFTAIIDNAPRRLISSEQLSSLSHLRDELAKNVDKAEETKNSLYALANSDPKFQKLADQLAPLLDQLAKIAAGARQVKTDLAGLGGASSWADSEKQSMSAFADMQKSNQAFIDAQTKRNSLSKEQLAIETEIANVRKEAEAAGAVLTDKKIRELAEARVTANERRTAEGKKTAAPKKTADDRFDSLTQNIYDRIDAMKLEQQTLSASFYEQQKRATALDLEQEALRQVREEARRKGDQDWQNAQLSPDQVKRIDEVSEAYARQADELRKNQEAQALQRDLLKGAFSDVRSALEDGKLDWKDLGDIALNALDKIIDKIENDLIDAIMQANSAADGGGGGLLGWLTKGLGALLGGGSGFTPNTTLAGVLGVPGYAEGTNNHPGGLAIVGEKGPELLNLPRGAQVIPQVPRMPELIGGQRQQSQGIQADIRVFFDENGNLDAKIERISQKQVKDGFIQFDKGSAYRTARDLRTVNDRGYAR